MQLIQRVVIRDFRSMDRFELAGLGDAVALVGPNGVGKSNVLRALNLFFNGEIEPGVHLDLSRDFHKPRRRRQKACSVGVELSFSSEFKIPKALEPLAAEAGISPPCEIAVEKTWTFDGASRITTQMTRVGGSLEQLAEAGTSQAFAVDRILQLVRFRYIPNHVHPSEILRAEQPALRTALVSRLKKTSAYRDSLGAQMFNELANVAKNLIQPIGSQLAEGSRAVEALDLSTPTDWGDVVWEFALLLQTPSGDSFGTLLQGSGTQAYLTYLLLDYIDNNYGTSFGWRQATVWALEEPESYLHSDLQERAASFLANRSAGPKLQTFLTTHSPLFMSVDESGYFVDLADSASSPENLPSRDLIERGYGLGVSPFVHPLLTGTGRPLLLVEGTTDAEYILARIHRSRVEIADSRPSGLLMTC